MLIKLILLFIINPLNVISGEGIGVLFNKTVILDNSTITWENFNIFQCTVSSTEINETLCFTPTTMYLDQTWLTTEQNQIGTSTEILTTVSPTSLYTCSNGYFGVNCNISSDICDIINPCFNGGICYSNNTLSSGYFCQCASGFSGYDCEYDNRICSENTCWNNGTCIEMNTTISGNTSTSFTCQCISGYDGIHCELQSNMCLNITCENQAICVSSYLTWSCQCLDSSSYSGIYCQEKSSSLVLKQILSKSFAIAAIIAMCCVVGFVLIMDILKYVFGIDPVDRERHRLQMEKEKKEQKKFRKKKVNKGPSNLITRFSAI